MSNTICVMCLINEGLLVVLLVMSAQYHAGPFRGGDPVLPFTHDYDRFSHGKDRGLFSHRPVPGRRGSRLPLTHG
jgi:hypothetical protein